jgi:hypothetical protein
LNFSLSYNNSISKNNALCKIPRQSEKKENSRFQKRRKLAGFSRIKYASQEIEHPKSRYESCKILDLVWV